MASATFPNTLQRNHGLQAEFNALRAIDALSPALSISAAVLRDGHRQVVPAMELVPGDIVFLQSGDKVAADVRLIKLRDLQIDESALTGESVPVEKNTQSLPPDTVLADRRDMEVPLLPNETPGMYDWMEKEQLVRLEHGNRSTARRGPRSCRAG